MTAAEAKGRLAEDRGAFRKRMEAENAAEQWDRFPGRIGVVLAGGGGRGAYEAGVLLAFQDAHMPTHLITGASIGGINAASFASHSQTRVGNAEPLLRTWFRLTPLAVGIDWTRYVWKLIGLIAASAGIGNVGQILLERRGIHLSLPHPLWTWLALAITGLAVLYFYDSMPYFGYVLRHHFNRAARRRSGFVPDYTRALGSLAANVLIWGSLAALLVSVGVLNFLAELLHPFVALTAAIAAGVIVAGRLFAPQMMTNLLHRFFRLPFRRGLFTNFDRTRLMRRIISEKKLRASPIRIVFPAADLEGQVVYFGNASTQELASDPGCDPDFAAQIGDPGDLILALAATSALPMAFEPIRFRGRLLADGGLVTSQPIRPAVRLGANVLFLVSMEPSHPYRRRVRTFMDIGVRALNILVAQNFIADRKILDGINAICEHAAESLGLRPEEVELDMGTRHYRYVKAFTISPARSLDANILDFGGVSTIDAIRQGYRDATAQVAAFLQYVGTARYGGPKRLLRLQAVEEVLSSEF